MYRENSYRLKDHGRGSHMMKCRGRACIGMVSKRKIHVCQRQQKLSTRLGRGLLHYTVWHCDATFLTRLLVDSETNWLIVEPTKTHLLCNVHFWSYLVDSYAWLTITECLGKMCTFRLVSWIWNHLALSVISNFLKYMFSIFSPAPWTSCPTLCPSCKRQSSLSICSWSCKNEK